MPPPGETFNKEGNFYCIIIMNNNITTTTNTSIYNTTNGTNAAGPGGTDSGSPKTGPGSDGDGNEGTASGGGDCDSPPIVSGDQILAMVATQSWATRCAVEAGNSAKVTGDVGNCAQPFSVEGDSANAEQLRAMRAQICGDGTQIGSVDGLIAAQEGQDADIFADEGTAAGFNLGLISGGGGGCPVLPSVSIGGMSWSAPPEFCQLIALLRLLFIGVATVWGLRIVAGE
jgi:hypothetical protein